MTTTEGIQPDALARNASDYRAKAKRMMLGGRHTATASEATQTLLLLSISEQLREIHQLLSATLVPTSASTPEPSAVPVLVAKIPHKASEFLNYEEFRASEPNASNVCEANPEFVAAFARYKSAANTTYARVGEEAGISASVLRQLVRSVRAKESTLVKLDLWLRSSVKRHCEEG